MLVRRRQSRERFQRIIDYCTDPVCRRRRILNYFGQSFSPPCGACDVCHNDEQPAQRAGVDPAADQAVTIILRTIAQHDGRLGRTLASDILVGSRRRIVVEQGFDRSPSYSALRISGKTRVLYWIDDLIDRRLLTVKGSFPHVYITEKGRTALAAASGSPKVGTTDRQSTPAAKGQPAKTTGSQDVPKHIAPALAARMEGSTAARPPSPDQQPGLLGESRFSGLRLNIEMWKQGGSTPDPNEIVHAIKDSAGATSGDLVVFLGAIADLGYRPALILVQRILKEGSEPSIVAAACRAAGKLGAPSAAGDLIRLLDSSSPLIRSGSSHALGCLRLAVALPKLEKLAEGDSSISVRLAARAACQLIKATKPEH